MIMTEELKVFQMKLV